MLTTEQKQENRMKFLELLGKLDIDLTDLSKYLDEIDYFEKPVNAANFRSYPGGLCSYALDLHTMIRKLGNAFFPGQYTDADYVKVALFRDLYRAELYEQYNKNVKDDSTGMWCSVPAYRVKEVRPVFGEIGFSSYMIAKYFVKFSDEQVEAICYGRVNDSGTDMREVQRIYPLVTLIRMADMAISNFGDN